ncbi:MULTISPECIES: SCO family protein [unclassified Roseitalea]|uniref:SCO family protein n=1 Tax=unclassified Roseitalea TaxID=2639107 RepID=UPI00273FB490|nr:MULTISPECIES: SCO family protein [unclassified Roseitalea]
MRYVFAALVIALGIAIFALTYSVVNRPEAEAAYGVPFELVDQDGRAITEQAFRGQPTALFFGFTHCPEICPTTLYELDGWLAALGEAGADIDAYFVTIDPERDTPELLGDYVASVTDRVRGISGEPEAVREMARGFGVYFKRVELDDGDYTMDHTASVFLLDSNGAFRKTIAWGENPDTAIEKLRDLADS